MEFNWGTGLFIIIYHTVLAITLPLYLYYYTPSLILILITFILVGFAGISVTTGYHRLFSHRSYKTNKITQFLLLLGGTYGVQGSALEWSRDHRLHHAHVDTDKDPYSINKGLIYAHVLWIFEKGSRDLSTVPDLTRNMLVRLQDKYYVPILIFVLLAPTLIVGKLLGDYVGAFMMTFLLRIFLTQHTTWMINSLAHSIGSKPYSKAHTAVNNWFLSFLTYGEGYHNYHHTFPNDYRNGTKWWHVDPTKALIWSMNKVGMASNLRRVNPYRAQQLRIIQEKKELLSKAARLKLADVEKRLHNLSEKIATSTNQIIESAKEYKIQKNKEQKKRIRYLKQSLKFDIKSWDAIERYLATY
jgi:stearoyl-CoA desaturase (Delta-9 desaturase)